MASFAHKLKGSPAWFARNFIGREATAAQARRFLFLQYPTALGAGICATPMFEALKKAVPEAYIGVAGHPMACDILRHNPHIDEIHCTPHPQKEFAAAARFFAQHRGHFRRNFDYVVIDSASGRPRVDALAVLSGVPSRFGMTHPNHVNHRSVPFDETASVIENNRRLITGLGHEVGAVEPAVFFSPDDLRQTTDLLSTLGVSRSRPLIAFQTQTSGGQPSQWFDDRFAAVADTVIDRLGAGVIFTGTASESRKIDALRAGMKNASFSAAGKTSVSQLAALLGQCDLLVTLDTGTMHIGRAVDVPMVVVAPAWQPAHEWLPLGFDQYRIVRRDDIGCRHCRKFHCATHECMDEIHPEAVFAAITQQMNQYPPDDSKRHSRLHKRLGRRLEFSLK